MGKGRDDGLRDLCARMHDDDGVDPRRERRSADRVKDFKLIRKDEHLAKFAFLATERVLAENVDSIGAGAFVMDAEVRGSGSHVHVRVCVSDSADRRTAEQWLAAITPRVRAELARQLNRRRTPSVRLQWCPPYPPEDCKENLDEH